MLPAVSAAAERALPAPTKYNTAPPCPVSPDHPLCGPWDVPVDPHNPFNGTAGYGQCTWWSYERRPDLYNDISNNDPAPGDWGPESLVGHARWEGLAVDGHPQVGDLAIWTPQQAGATGEGHVAYVEAVQNQDIIVTEMNTTTYGPHGDTALLTPSPAPGGWGGLQFIHRTYSAPPPPPKTGSGGQQTAHHLRSPHLTLRSLQRHGLLVTVVISTAPSARGKLSLAGGRYSYRLLRVAHRRSWWHATVPVPVGNRISVYFTGAAGWRSQGFARVV